MVLLITDKVLSTGLWFLDWDGLVCNVLVRTLWRWIYLAEPIDNGRLHNSVRVEDRFTLFKLFELGLNFNSLGFIQKCSYICYEGYRDVCINLADASPNTYARFFLLVLCSFSIYSLAFSVSGPQNSSTVITCSKSFDFFNFFDTRHLKLNLPIALPEVCLWNSNPVSPTGVVLNLEVRSDLF